MRENWGGGARRLGRRESPEQIRGSRQLCMSAASPIYVGFAGGATQQAAYSCSMDYAGYDGGCRSKSMSGGGGFSAAGRCFRCLKAVLGRAVTGLVGCVGSLRRSRRERRLRRRRRGSENVTTIRTVASTSPYVYDPYHAKAIEDCIEFVNSFYKERHSFTSPPLSPRCA